ncbi:hypothetical protein [Novosphingobium sp.]|uniref:hypothetical protein n=1 Tax=Novosphingobium sp. TaxID=1874826 RepID=UPI0035AECBA1
MKGRAPSRLLMLGGTLVYLCLALGNGLDRISAQSPLAAGYVPHLFAAQADRTLAALALGEADKTAAVSAARKAVRSDPADWRTVGLLGGALLAAGKPYSADQAFRVAAQFGWRDRLTQLHLMNRALDGAQPAIAAMRLDAVLRQDPQFPLRDMLLARFEAQPAGRGALASRLALHPSWTDAFLGQGGQLNLQTLRQRASVLQSLPTRKWGCDLTAPLVLQLVKAGDATTAKRLWLAQCPGASTGIADGRFTGIALARPGVPFEWNLQSAGDVTVQPTSGRSGGILGHVSAASSRMAAWQMLTLSPGRYRIGWTALNDGSPARGTVTFSLTCALGKRSTLSPEAIEGSGRFAAGMQIDGQCAQQYLAIWLSPSSKAVLIDHVTFETLP